MAKSSAMTDNSASEGAMNQQGPGGDGSKGEMPDQKPPEKYTLLPTMVVKAPKASSLNTSAQDWYSYFFAQFAHKEWIGLKTNSDGDVILCLGSGACSASSNVSNATAGDLGLKDGALAVSAIPLVGKVIKPSVTKSTLKRIKRLITNLPDNRNQTNGLSQTKVEQLQRIVKSRWDFT